MEDKVYMSPFSFDSFFEKREFKIKNKQDLSKPTLHHFHAFKKSQDFLSAERHEQEDGSDDQANKCKS